MSQPTAATAPQGPTWERSLPVTTPDAGGPLIAGIRCSNMPTDGFVAVSMAGPDEQNSVSIPRTPITSPYLVLIQQVDLPPDFRTSMVIRYWQGATTPPPGASISPVLAIPAQAGELAAGALSW